MSTHLPQSNERTELASRRDTLSAAEPHLRTRDLAARLKISEAELLALDDATGSVRLRPDWTGILSRLHRVGEVMALTRNANAVHEKVGTYGTLAGNSQIGLFTGEAIDLRLFLTRWRFAWAIHPTGSRHSIQIFGSDGAAVHKIFATPRTNMGEWHSLVHQYAAPDIGTPEIVPPPEFTPEADDAMIDVAGFVKAWDGLRDTHHFHGLLKKFNVSRTQGFRLAGADRARPVAPGSLRIALQSAATARLPVMVFVGNHGCIQIHSGCVERLLETAPWFNVLDPEFNLHVRETAISLAWVVAKPTDDGVVTSLELFDDSGQAIATMFGRRAPGEPEDRNWRDLCHSLPGA